MLIEPNDHYRLHEHVVTTASELREFIDEVLNIADRTECDVYWRGQADNRWGVLSSLARLTETPTGLRDQDLASAERRLLHEAKEWVTAAPEIPEQDLEWLALFQHHGVPTRLVDFTRDPLIATFFAVESLDAVEGRLFAVAVPRGQTEPSGAAPGFAIGDLPVGELRMWQPSREVSPRLVAQDGVFAVGRLPSTTPARHVLDQRLERERLMLRAEVVSVLSIPLYLVSLERGSNRRESVHPSCFTARIHVDKNSVREQLARKQSGRGALRPSGAPINHARCYPDVDGMRTYSRTLERVRRGI